LRYSKIMKFISPEVCHVGTVPEELFTELYLPPRKDEYDPGFYIYSLIPLENSELLLAAQSLLKPLHQKISETLGVSQSGISLDCLDIGVSNTMPGYKYCTGDAQDWHLDGLESRQVDVLVANIESSEFLVGTFDEESLPESARSMYQRNELLKIDDQTMVNKYGMSIQQSMPYEAMLIRETTFHRAPLNNINSFGSRIVIAATFSY